MLNERERAVIERAKQHMRDTLGYRFEVSDDGTEERVIRPDGTVAVIARKRASESIEGQE